MKLFNFLKKKKIKKLEWSDVTLEKFIQLQDIFEVQDEWTMNNVIDCLYGIDSSQLSIIEYQQYLNGVAFLNKELSHNWRVPKEICLNGRKYRTNIDLQQVTTAQYIDFTNYAKSKQQKLQDFLSVFIIPVDHTYNDGYDINTTKQDILQLPITYVSTLTFFFKIEFQLYTKIFQRCFKQQIKKMKGGVEMEKMMELSNQILEQSVSVLFHT